MFAGPGGSPTVAGDGEAVGGGDRLDGMNILRGATVEVVEEVGGVDWGRGGGGIG